VASDKKRDLIIAAGARVFPELGYHLTTVEDVIKDAGVARSTFYSCFSNKRELFIDVVTGKTDEIVEIVRGGVDAIIAQFEDPLIERATEEMFEGPLALLSTSVFDFVRKYRGVTKIFLHELVGADQEFTRIYSDFHEQLVDQFQRLVECGIETGVMRRTDPRTAAEFVVSGHMYLARSFSAGRDPFDAASAAHRFSDLQFRGLIKRSGVQSGNSDMRSTAGSEEAHARPALEESVPAGSQASHSA
jgi:AcrR family transcriptional regulator